MRTAVENDEPQIRKIEYSSRFSAMYVARLLRTAYTSKPSRKNGACAARHETSRCWGIMVGNGIAQLKSNMEMVKTPSSKMYSVVSSHTHRYHTSTPSLDTLWCLFPTSFPVFKKKPAYFLFHTRFCVPCIEFTRTKVLSPQEPPNKKSLLLLVYGFEQLLNPPQQA